MEQRHSIPMDFDLGGLVLPMDKPQGLDEDTAEVVHALVAIPELRLERFP